MHLLKIAIYKQIISKNNYAQENDYIEDKFIQRESVCLDKKIKFHSHFFFIIIFFIYLFIFCQMLLL